MDQITIKGTFKDFTMTIILANALPAFSIGDFKKLLKVIEDDFDHREELIETVAKLNPRKVVYISCNPATLARDLAIFQAEGYAVGDVQPVNLFPRTAHCESVVCLTRTFDN